LGLEAALSKSVAASEGKPKRMNIDKASLELGKLNGGVLSTDIDALHEFGDLLLGVLGHLLRLLVFEGERLDYLVKRGLTILVEAVFQLLSHQYDFRQIFAEGDLGPRVLRQPLVAFYDVLQ